MPPTGTAEASADPAVRPFGAGSTSQRPPRPARGTFRALRHRNYRLYFFAQLVSLTGSWMQTTALTWLAFALTGRSGWTALITTAQVLPTFFLGPWGGILADRWPKRWLIFATQAVFTLLAFVLAAFTFAGSINVWGLLLVSVAGGVVQAVDLPARLSFVHDMAGRDDLMNAVALNSLLFNLARAAGPAVAAWLLLRLGPGLCFLANAVSFLPVLWALRRMSVNGAPARAGGPRAGVRDALLEGFRYLTAHPLLSFLVLLAGVVALCGWPFLALLPALAAQVLDVGEAGYGRMLSSTGIGALAAALVVARAGSLRRWKRFVAAGVGLVAAALGGLALARLLPLAEICCGLIGFGLILFLATGQSVVQLSAGDHHRGRVMAVWAAVLSGAVPVGTLLAGPAADRWGMPVVLFAEGLTLAVGAAVLLASLLFWLRRRRAAVNPRSSSGAPG